MKKIRLGIICGGMSTEHDVSLDSANSILKNIDKSKYVIFRIYIEKNGDWYRFADKEDNLVTIEKNNESYKIDNIIEFLKGLDVVFPVLHGLYGEDGTIQGLLELIKVPYVGCKVLASSIGMDKVYSKMIFENAGLNQARYEYIKVYKNRDENKYFYIDKNLNEKIFTIKEVLQLINNNLKYPMFVKPANSGSSIGINKAKNLIELKEYIRYASKFDNKIIIEEGIQGIEVECAILGNESVTASCVGEIKPGEDFYSYDAKYKKENTKVSIPASIDKNISEEIRKQAIKAFKAIDARGLARVDFFVEDKTNKIYINEINTLPGFTNISMYPKLFLASGIEYTNLIDMLIELAIEKNP